MGPNPEDKFGILRDVTITATLTLTGLRHSEPFWYCLEDKLVVFVLPSIETALTCEVSLNSDPGLNRQQLNIAHAMCFV